LARMERVWRRHVQKGTKRVYYVNTVTRKTQWKSPGDDKLLVAKKKRRVKPQLTPVDGRRVWKAKVQKSTGRSYYVVRWRERRRACFVAHAAFSFALTADRATNISRRIR